MSTALACRGAAYPKAVHPTPLIDALPALYHGDDFTNRWLSVFDDVLGPIVDSIDSLDAYLNPQLAPDDFVRWLASWVGVLFHHELDDPGKTERLRTLAQRAVTLFGIRGTAVGIREFVEAAFPVHCIIIEGGAVSWSLTPGQQIGGTATGVFIVRVMPLPRDANNGDLAPPPEGFDTDRLQRQVRMLVEQLRPAHLPTVVELDGWPANGASAHLAEGQS
jgi:phage tail-like protein